MVNYSRSLRSPKSLMLFGVLKVSKAKTSSESTMLSFKSFKSIKFVVVIGALNVHKD